MLGIQIDISQVAEEFYLDKSEINSFAKFVVEVVSSRFRKEWEEQAKDNLHQTRNQYIRSLYVQSVNDNTKVVGLAGQFPNMVEQGCSAFDMKEGFEKSNKRVVKLLVDKKGKVIRDKDGKTSSGGWYLTIPFRAKSSDEVIGDSEIFSGTLPDELHEILKNKSKQGDNSGLKLFEMPEKFKILSSRPEIKLESKVFEEYIHKSPLHEGTIKSPMEYHSQYTSFRRVSDLSDPNAFIHPGITANNLAEKALNNLNIEVIVDKAIDNFLQTI